MKKHIYINMRWYEETGPDTKEVTGNMTAMALESPVLLSDDCREKIISEVIASEEGYGWGSYRGYAVSVHNGLLKKCNAELRKFIQKRARKIIGRYIEPCITDRLYRPPTDVASVGLRYAIIETQFMSRCSENTPK